MTPAALGGAEPDASEPHTTLPPDTTELLQRAFQQGAEYALQQQAEEQAEERRKQLDGQVRANEGRERALRARIEALKEREYRAPVVPIGTICKDERAMAIDCYRAVRGAPPGEVVAQCQATVDALEKCATLVREAALANIGKDTLKSK